MNSTRLYILTIFVLASQMLFAQVGFKTSVSKTNLGVNQRFKIEFSVNKQGADNFKPPSFADFKVVGGPSSSVSQSWITEKQVIPKPTFTYLSQKKKVNLSLNLQLLNITMKL